MADQEQESWQNLSHVNNSCWPRSYSTRQYDRFLSYNNNNNNNMSVTVRRSKASIWTQLWRRLKREKKRMSRRSNSMRFTYDEYSYSQNFDQGLVWAADPDDLSRSFSARFAVPSRIFEKHRFMV